MITDIRSKERNGLFIVIMRGWIVSQLFILSSIGCVVSWSDWHADNCRDGRRVMVHLFEWKWRDIAEECERFLGPMGFCGVQVSPVAEHILSPGRSWWERYQPVSYTLESRSGDREDFEDMVERCNAVDVRIYVDVVMNHMTNEAYTSENMPAIAGSMYSGQDGDYPEVPYDTSNFNGCDDCPEDCIINDWTDAEMVRTCRVAGLVDLDQSNEGTSQMIIDFLNDLIGIGVAGFRINAAKHMYPEDLEAIWRQLDPLNVDYFPANSNPFIFLEVSDVNRPGEITTGEYKDIGRVTEFRFGMRIVDVIDNPPSIGGIWDPSTGMLDPDDALVFVDNHESQRGYGDVEEVVTYKDGDDYKMAQALTLAFTYGLPRLMSSYNFDNDTEAGPPMDEFEITADVPINVDGSCGGGWVCEHRWTEIAGMVSWAKATSGQDILTWWEDGSKLAFSRGGRGFVAFNDPDEVINTGLPAGTYCNVLEGCPTTEGCVGEEITVEDDGTAYVSGKSLIAIHVEAMSGSNQCVEGVPAPTNQPPTQTPVPTTHIPTEKPTTEYPTDEQTTEYLTDEPTTAYLTDEPTTEYPTDEPTTAYPTDEPTTAYPTDEPTTAYPTEEPTTAYPTNEPTTEYPTDELTTTYPTDEPTTGYPTDEPTTGYPTDEPTTAYPTNEPTTEYPTDEPTTAYPTNEPTTEYPTDEPTTTYPTDEPTTEYPTDEPTNEYPTDEPTTEYPTNEPTTEYPTDEPTTEYPTVKPTTEYPTDEPTTEYPTDEPTTEFTTDEPTTEFTTVQTTTLEPLQRTIIYIDAISEDGQHVFYLGGLDENRRPGCADASSACALSIDHVSVGSSGHYAAYNAWLEGDTKLDWFGPEPGQGKWEGVDAFGTPSVWTTNDGSHPGFQPDNEWGPYQWKVEFDMNCTETEDGWFEFKAFKYIPGRPDGGDWEFDINQDDTCLGSLGGDKPFESVNHIARCGALNKYTWNQPYCVINTIS